MIETGRGLVEQDSNLCKSHSDRSHLLSITRAGKASGFGAEGARIEEIWQ